MKVLHLADLHLGKSVNEFSMIEDQKYILNELLTIAEEKKAEAVLIAGDVYDKSIPSEEAVKLLDGFLSALSEKGIAVLMISGNHDSDERLSFASELLVKSGIYIYGSYDGSIHSVTLQDAYGQLNFHLLPFVKASHVHHYFPEEEMKDYDAAIRIALSRHSINKEERNILLAHQFVSGNGYDPESAGSENVASNHVGTIEKVEVSAFDDYDYVALGHIHRPQKVGRETVRYAGSPLRYSLNEINQNKSVPLLDIKEKGNVEIELIPLKPLREMRHIKGEMEKILNPANIRDTEDYIYVTLTDENAIPDAMHRLQMYYPHVLRLDYQNSHTEGWQAEDGGSVEQLSFREIMENFFLKMNGREMRSEEWEILSEAGKKAGVSNASD